MNTEYRQTEVLPIELAGVLPGVVYQGCHTPEGIRTIIYATESIREMFGLTPEEIIADVSLFERTIHPDDRGRIRERMFEHVRTLEPWSESYRIVIPGCEPRWVRSVASLERRPNGDTIWTGFLMDITHSQQADEALWLSERNFSEIWKHSGVGMALVSKEGRFMESNPALCRFLRRNEEDLRETNFQTLTHPSDLARDVDMANRLLRGEINTYTMEKRYLAGNGVYIWGLLTVALARNAAGEALYFISQIQDIDQRKQAEQKLRLSEERIAIAADAGHVGMWDYDFITGQVIWNDTQYEIHGVTRETFSPNPERNARFLHPDDASRVWAAFEQCAKQKDEHYEIECRIIRPDGEVRTTRSNALMLYNDEGTLIRAVGTEVDITEERQVMKTIDAAREAAEAATQAKSDFLARMSHEIRTPMNAILAPAQLLSTSDIPSSQRSLAAMIVEAGEHLLQIINDILDFSKLEAGKMSLVTDTFSLAELVEETRDLMSLLAQNKGLTLRQEFNASAEGDWLGDAGRIRQVLLNLIANAIKFTPAGEICLQVDLKENEGVVRLAVRDTGIGMTEEEKKLLFHPFEQTPVRHKNYQSGTGLGLAICRDLVELMGGRIGVESEPDRGSTFWFTVPLERSLHLLPHQSNKATPEAAAPPAPAPGAQILVVEDNASNRRVAAFLLARLGHHVHMAVNGLEAVEKFETQPFDLIIMDCEMPIMNGLESTREIQRRMPPHGHIPIVALTAHVSAEHRRACLEAGMDDMLSKPIMMVDLEKMLSRWLRSPISPR